MKFTFPFKYTEEVIPSRCRKPRRVTYEDGSVTIHIKEVNAEDAPVAFDVKEYGRESRLVRLYKGKLYRQWQDRDVDYDKKTNNDPNYYNENNPLWKNYPSSALYAERYGEKVPAGVLNWSLQWRSDWYKTKEENINAIKTNAKDYIVVDGYIYERCGEPFYYCNTFGLGNNHGGTGFFIGWTDTDRRRKMNYGYTALDKADAVAKTIQVALDRGDDKSVDHIENTSYNIDVFIPNAVKKVYPQDY